MNFYIWACALLQKNIEKLLNKLAKSREKILAVISQKRMAQTSSKKFGDIVDTWEHITWDLWVIIDIHVSTFEHITMSLMIMMTMMISLIIMMSMRTYQLTFVGYNWSVGPIDRHSRYMLQRFLLFKTQVCWDSFLLVFKVFCPFLLTRAF